MSKQKSNCHFMVKIIRHLANNCQFHPELFQIRMWKNLHLNWTSAVRSDPTQPAASLTQDKDTILGEKVWLILANLRYSRALILTLWTKAILGSGWAVNTPRSSIGLGQVVRLLISGQHWQFIMLAINGCSHWCDSVFAVARLDSGPAQHSVWPH